MYVHRYIHTYIHTDIHTYPFKCTHKCIHQNILQARPRIPKHTRVSVWVFTHKCSHIDMYGVYQYSVSYTALPWVDAREITLLHSIGGCLFFISFMSIIRITLTYRTCISPHSNILGLQTGIATIVSRKSFSFVISCGPK